MWSDFRACQRPPFDYICVVDKGIWSFRRFRLNQIFVKKHKLPWFLDVASFWLLQSAVVSTLFLQLFLQIFLAAQFVRLLMHHLFQFLVLCWDNTENFSWCFACEAGCRKCSKYVFARPSCICTILQGRPFCWCWFTSNLGCGRFQKFLLSTSAL